MIMVIDVFHHRIYIHFEGMTARKGDGGEWEWDLAEAALWTKGLFTIREYVRRHQATIMEYVAGRPI